MTARTDAATPIDWYDGVSARPMMPMPIRVKDRIIAGLRPRRSANRPMIRPPSGLPTKPTPKVASDRSKDCEASPGNSVRPIWTAKKL